MKKRGTCINALTGSVAVRISNTGYEIECLNLAESHEDGHTVMTIKDYNEKSARTVVEEYREVIAKNSTTPSVTTLVEFTIDINNNYLVYSTPRRYHPALQQKMDEQFEELKRKRMIDKVTFTSCGSPVTAVSKPE